MEDLIKRDDPERARLFTIAAHTAVGQVRKYTNKPYWLHPKAVSSIVASVPHNDRMLCAAWLHDVVEDTKVPLSVIMAEFGVEVAHLVQWLTDVSRPEDGNRAVRKAIDRAHIARAPAEAKTIKLADLIDNSRNILERDPGFAKVYLEEKAKLLEVLTEGDATLWTQANDIVVKSLGNIAHKRG